MKFITQNIKSLALLLVLGGYMVLPGVANAATGELACNLIAITNMGAVLITGEADISVIEGEDLTFIWQGVNADTGYGPDRKRVPLLNLAKFTPEESTEYSYRFYQGNKKVACVAHVTVVSGDITNSTLSTTSDKPTIRGEATGADSVYLEIYEDTAKKPYYTSKVAKVKNGDWSFKVTKSLDDGEYTAVLRGDKDHALNIIAIETLQIGRRSENTTDSNADTSIGVEKSATTFVTELVPLLVGGTATAGKNVPISYLQVINIGKTVGTVTGFKVKQNGNASVSALTNLTVNSELGTHAVAEASNFKNGEITLPVAIPIEAGQMMLFTLKAQLAPNVTSELTKQYKLDVSDVETNATMQGKFPVRGTTWTVGL